MSDFGLEKDDKFVDIHGREIYTTTVGPGKEIVCLLSDLKQTGVAIYQKSQYAKLSTIKKDFGTDFVEYMLESAKSYMLSNKISFTENQIMNSIEYCKECVSHNQPVAPRQSNLFLTNRKVETGSDDEIVIKVSNTQQPVTPPQQKSPLVKGTPLKPRRQPLENEGIQSSSPQQPTSIKFSKKVSPLQTVQNGVKNHHKSPKGRQSKFSYNVETKEYEVLVVAINKRNCIWVRDVRNEELLETIHKKVNEEAKGQRPVPKPYVMDKVYMAQDMGSWFRCKLVRYSPLTVFFLDYGNVAEVDEIREVSAELANTPCLAVRITFKENEYIPRLEDSIRIRTFVKNEDGTYFVNIISTSPNSVASNPLVGTSSDQNFEIQKRQNNNSQKPYQSKKHEHNASSPSSRAPSSVASASSDQNFEISKRQSYNSQKPYQSKKHEPGPTSPNFGIPSSDQNFEMSKRQNYNSQKPYFSKKHEPGPTSPNSGNPSSNPLIAATSSNQIFEKSEGQNNTQKQYQSKKPDSDVLAFFAKPEKMCDLENDQRVTISYLKNDEFFLRTKSCFEKLKKIERMIEEHMKNAKNLKNVKNDQLVLCQNKGGTFCRAIVTKVLKNKAEVELLDHVLNFTVEISALKTISEELSKEPITIFSGGKLMGFETDPLNENHKRLIEEYIKQRKKFTVVLGFDDELDFYDGNLLLSQELEKLEKAPKILLLKDIKTYNPETGIKPYVCGNFKSSKEFAVVPSQELEKHIDIVLRVDVEDDVPYTPVVGEVCLCFYVDHWYRCVVSRIFDKECEVIFLDFGKIELIKRENLRKADEEFVKVPALAVPCVLVGMPPHHDVEDLLKKMIIEGEIYKVDVKEISGGKWHVELPMVYKKIKDDFL